MAVVDLLRVVYVRMRTLKGSAQRHRRLQVVLELLVEALLDQETGKVIPVDQAVQSRVELCLYGIPLRKLQHGIAYHDAVPIAQGTLSGAPEGFAVHHGAFAGAQVRTTYAPESGSRWMLACLGSTSTSRTTTSARNGSFPGPAPRRP